MNKADIVVRRLVVLMAKGFLRTVGAVALRQVPNRAAGCRATGWFSAFDAANVILAEGVRIGQGAYLGTGSGTISLGARARIRERARLATIAGRIEIAHDAVIGEESVLKTKQETLVVGPKAWIARSCILEGAIQVGADALLAPFVHVVAGKHVYREKGLPINEQGSQSEPVVIGSDVWLGSGVVVTGGVTIGTGAVIGARSVVTKNIPAYAVAFGAPAKVKRYRGSEDCGA